MTKTVCPLSSQRRDAALKVDELVEVRVSSLTGFYKHKCSKKHGHRPNSSALLCSNHTESTPASSKASVLSADLTALLKHIDLLSCVRIHAHFKTQMTDFIDLEC